MNEDYEKEYDLRQYRLLYRHVQNKPKEQYQVNQYLGTIYDLFSVLHNRDEILITEVFRYWHWIDEILAVAKDQGRDFNGDEKDTLNDLYDKIQRLVEEKYQEIRKPD